MLAAYEAQQLETMTVNVGDLANVPLMGRLPQGDSKVTWTQEMFG